MQPPVQEVESSAAAAGPVPARPRPDLAGPVAARSRPDLAGPLRGFLTIDLAARLLIWCGAFAGTTAIFTALGAWPALGPINAGPALAWRWALRLAEWMLLFNYLYVIELLILRLPIPTPREGVYPIGGRVPPLPILWSCLLAVLTKARYEAPFPGFLVFHVANLPPLCWLMSPIFGPRSRSCYVLDPQILDPHLVTLGRNVTIGFRATIAGHYQERDAVVFRRTIIEDDVLIGGHAAIFGGVHIQRGAVIAAGAVVLPNTVIGPDEFWRGAPARRVRSVPPASTGVSPEGPPC